MAFEWRRRAATLLSGIVLTSCGAAMVATWRAGLWGSWTGAVLVAAWIVALAAWIAGRPAIDRIADARAPVAEALPLGAVLDQVPMPLLRCDGDTVRALNRAARALFATDDRVVPAPAALLDRDQHRLRHEARSWRIERIDPAGGPMLAMLIDIDAEERAAELRAGDEMIDVLGHELLNGLSPIVSLADSALTAATHGDAMLPEILATLARRIEGLERFTLAYRTLARLPDPAATRVVLPELADDLARLFAGRFAGVTLAVEAADAIAVVDRDQITQAIWALLQNGAEAALGGSGPPSVRLTAAMDGPMLTIAVSNSGAPVPAPDRARIFRPFHTTKPDGSGIGLSIARRIARAHDGDVSLTPDARTTFRLTARCMG